MMRRWKYFLLVILIAIGFQSFLPCSVYAVIRVEPSRLILTMQGERLTGTIEVTNRGTEEADLIANMYDWTLAEESDQMVDYPPNTLPETLDGWIRFNPRSFTLEPGQTQLVRFTVAPPPGEVIEFERRGVVFFEHTGFMEQDGIGARVVSMIGTTLYVIPPEYEMSFGLLDAMVRRTDEGLTVAHMAVGNSGPVHVRYRVSYRILDQSHSIVHEEAFPTELILLPGFVRTPAFLVDSELAPGPYQMVVRLHMDQVREPLTHSVEFEVPEG